jgi:putative phosphoesterase
MRIGVVSDTHDNARNVARIVEILNRAGVDRVVHTGDITRAATLDRLAGLEAPLFGVYGNNDVLREELDEASERNGFVLAEPPFEMHWAERRILIVHDPREAEGVSEGEHDLVLHGHTHRRIVTRSEHRLTFNPGECAGMLEGHNAVGVVDLATLTPDLLLF